MHHYEKGMVIWVKWCNCQSWHCELSYFHTRYAYTSYSIKIQEMRNCNSRHGNHSDHFYTDILSHLMSVHKMMSCVVVGCSMIILYLHSLQWLCRGEDATPTDYSLLYRKDLLLPFLCRVLFSFFFFLLHHHSSLADIPSPGLIIIIKFVFSWALYIVCVGNKYTPCHVMPHDTSWNAILV